MNGFYWIYLIMFAAMLCYNFTTSKENKRLLFYGASGFLILMFVVQDFSVSADMAEYMRQYDMIPTLSLGQMLTHKFEIGYVLLCRVLEFLFEGRRVLLLVISILIMVPFTRLYENETEQPMVALMAFLALGMYQHALIFWRQLAAMAILTFSYRFVRERKLLPFLLTVLAAMTFHKASIVFVVIYVLYAIPINKWTLIVAAVISLLGGLFCEQIMDFILNNIITYHEIYHIRDGGETMLIVLWVVVLLSYWLLKERMNEATIRLPFLMVLTAAVLQPVCFAFYNWLRVVLFFRVALVALSAQLYTSIFCRKSGNKVLLLMERWMPKAYHAVLRVYDSRGFQIAAQCMMFAVLFLWYLSELDGAVYLMTPL